MIMKSLLLILSLMVASPHPPGWSTVSSFAYCKWKGVKCNPYTRGVISLNLSGFSLGRFISSEIGHLSALEEVYLQNNNLIGELPWSLAELPSLRILDVSNNNLTGDVPEFASSVKVIYRPGNLGLKDRSSSGKTMTAIVGSFIIVAIGCYAAFKLRELGV